VAKKPHKKEDDDKNLFETVRDYWFPGKDETDDPPADPPAVEQPRPAERSAEADRHANQGAEFRPQAGADAGHLTPTQQASAEAMRKSQDKEKAAAAERARKSAAKERAEEAAGQRQRARAVADAQREQVEAVQRAVGRKKAAEAAQRAQLRRHTVQAGETLSHLSLQYYGNANRWRQIYEANQDVIGENPNMIYAGQELIIPEDEQA
jgi:nucleoid-associated protein YgaU